MAITLSGGKIVSTLLPTPSKPAAPAAIQQYQSYQAPVTKAPTVSPPPSSGGGTTGTTTPTQSSPPLQSTPSFSPPDYDALIKPAIDAYNGYIGTLQSQLPGQLSSIDANTANQVAGINQSVTQQSGTVNAAKQTQQQNQKDAASQARQQFSELSQGLLNRYGSANGLGAFSTEIAGRATAQDIAKINTTGAQLIAGLDDKLQQIQQVGQLSVQDAEQKAADLKQQAQQQVEQEIAQIRSKIGETQANKAQLYAQAYQQYQQTSAQIDANNTAFKQQLYLQQQAAAQKIADAKNNISTIAQNLSTQNLGQYVDAAKQIQQAGFNPTVNIGQNGGGSLSFTLPQQQGSGQGIGIDPNTGQLTLQ